MSKEKDTKAEKAATPNVKTLNDDELDQAAGGGLKTAKADPTAASKYFDGAGTHIVSPAAPSGYFDGAGSHVLNPKDKTRR